MRKELEDIVEQFIYDLNGTCNDSHGFAEERGIEFKDIDEEIEFFSRVDDEIFRCETCSWWYELSEMSESEPNNCQNCAPDEER